ncbi:non-homologous end-joining DNA ligase [Dethiobacter alkaliphilus]|uniref:non-homologous end-joining DNA ligase n=1 Tax=Dethiobacter alkaliphilus TaxID=427926 RepID=UPI002227DCA8|nr:non-homologous end-joining DNA ligase [Dethiobacter alkaliphilus]MCW3491437.1 non-homologous end-joining DNA ligase [Dethiobacter alkaliphilus]
MPELEINNKKVKLSNLEKVFWPQEGYTKHDLISYYIEVSSYLLPFLKDRPCNFQRFPDGIEGKRFYQKNIPSFAPEWIETVPIASDKRTINYIVVNNLETLVFLANLACLEIHPWHSRRKKIKNPDWGIVDLDPQEGVNFSQVVETARAVKEVLDDLELKGYPKTSGATGMQIYIPFKPRYTYEQVRDIIGYICKLVHEKEPKITTMERMVKKRGDTVYLDYLQNLWGQTINAPYTVRPRPKAPVSTPLTWEEALSGKVSPSDFTIKNIFSRLEEKGDLFAPVLQGEQLATAILRRLK